MVDFSQRKNPLQQVPVVSFGAQPPRDIRVVLNEAIRAHQSGELAVAWDSYALVLRNDPANFDALHLKGVVAAQLGRHAEAIALIEMALVVKSDSADAYNNLGNAQLEMEMHTAAVESFRKAIHFDPQSFEALNNLGALLNVQHQYGEALACIDQAIELMPSSPDAYNNRGNALRGLGRLPESLESFQQAVLLFPGMAIAHDNLGAVLCELGQWNEGIESFDVAISTAPEFFDAYIHRGNALTEMMRYAEALTDYEKASDIRPNSEIGHHNRGFALRNLGRVAQALECYATAIRLKPEFAEAYANMADVVRDQGRLTDAEKLYLQAINIQPELCTAINNLAYVYQAQGKLVEAIACYRDALSRDPDNFGAYSNMLFAMLYMEQYSAQEVWHEHQRYAQRLQSHVLAKPLPHANERTPERRLKVGYVSADFRNHAVAYFIEPILAAHDKTQFEIYCYYNHTASDARTARIAVLADHWLACKGMSDEQLATRIRADGIDILVDLSGHTANNRLPMFARKPAPVQVTWIGCAGTTGLTAMDYRITDIYMDPPGMTECFHSETLLRLPGSNITYRPEPGCPDVNELPALATGRVVFASLNSLTKVNQSVVNLWSRILLALPQSTLMLANVTEDAIAQRLIAMFGSAGIASERLQLEPRMTMLDYLTLHHQIDVALDPFPYNGGTTSVHSLWMGVPVVTLAGKHAVSRVGVAVVSRVGLEQFAAHTEEEYFQCAVQTAQNLQALNQLRQSLRARMSEADCGPEGITRNLEDTYRSVWAKWCDA
jgi:protein O-GlcNAc transferase